MDFALTEAERELGGLTAAILADLVTAERLREVEAKDDRFDRALWASLADAGVLSAALPEAAGGAGLGLAAQCAVLVELGRSVAPVPYVASIVTGAAAVARFGDRSQADRWVAPAGRGEAVLTAALAEEGTVRAVRADAGWVLTGAQTAVPAAPYADLFLVPADAAGTPVVFLVEPTDEGVTVLPQRVVDGDGEGWLGLADVALGEDRVLGGVEAGAEVAGWLRDRGTIGLCAIQLGVLERGLELTAAYARTRQQFGRAIGSFQAVAQRLADAYIDVEAVRLTMWQAAWRLDAGLACPTEVGTAKFWAADAGHRVAHTAVHIHGGVGIDLDAPLHRYFVAAKHHEFSLGGATAQLRRVGAVLAAAVPDPDDPAAL